jgi:hypothetical protein
MFLVSTRISQLVPIIGNEESSEEANQPPIFIHIEWKVPKRGFGVNITPKDGVVVKISGRC